MRVWDAATGAARLTLTGHRQMIWAVAYSPDGRFLASSSWDKTVKVWDAATGREVLTFRNHNHLVNGLAFSPDGRWLASVGSDAMVRVWDPATGEEHRVLKGHYLPVSSVAWLKDGRLLTGDSLGTLSLWDVESGERRQISARWAPRAGQGLDLR